MAVPPPFPTASRYSPDELPVDVPGFREVPAAELVEEIARECRGCGATWQERTGHRSARPFPSSSPCEPSCVLSLADEVCGRCGTEREPGSLARDLDRPMLWWAAGGAVHLRGRP
ncbi:hypothetical protein [Prauserella muralis]|nr:hypothetical protein [Prauserella muralis]TWE29876.1 hypothetical protein FHX69_2568 [Prauserella muralis]